MKNQKLKISKKKMWQLKKPRYNGFAIGYGPHGDTKYNRRKNKQELRRQIDDAQHN